MIWNWFTGDAVIISHKSSFLAETGIDKPWVLDYDLLEAETGLTTGWKMTGCLHLAKTPERMYELKKGATTARSFGLEMNIITPAEAKKLFPIMDAADLVGAAFLPPGSGY